MTLDLKDFQTTAVTAIEAHEYFATGWTVYADDGAKKKERETALNNAPGTLVEVGMPIDSSIVQDAPGVVETDVLFPVEIAVNPELNAQAETPVNIPEAVDKMFAAMFTSGTGTSRFETVTKPFEMITNDPGLVSYVCWFRRITTLAPSA